MGNGHAAAFIARAPMTDGLPHVIGRYQPETVVDLATLLDRAAELGIDRDALAQEVDGYFGRSILDMRQDSHGWVHGLYAIVILAVQRPASLVGSPGRSVEVLPYVVRYELNAQSLLERNATVHPAFHAHALSPELLARTSGIPYAATSQPLVVLGCGSVGSKVAMQLGRAGFGSMTFVDNEPMSPHNAARHALIERASVLVPPRKSALMKTAFESLSHLQSRAFDTDAVTLLVDPEQFAATVPQDAALIVDATASLQVLAAETQSAALINPQPDWHGSRCMVRGAVWRYCSKELAVPAELTTSRRSCSSAAGLHRNCVRRLPARRLSRLGFSWVTTVVR